MAASASAPAPTNSKPSNYHSRDPEAEDLEVMAAPSAPVVAAEWEPEVGIREFDTVRILKSAEGHSYAHRNTIQEEGCRAGLGRCSTSKFMNQKWKTVPSPLPPNIYVWRFKNRIDLMRAVIVGATGTPVEGGIFWFDLRIGLHYPMTPLEITHRTAFPGLFNLGEQAGVPRGTLSCVLQFLNDYWKGSSEMQVRMPVRVDLPNVDDRQDNLGETLLWLQSWIQSGNQFLWEYGLEASFSSCPEYHETVVLMNLKSILLMLQDPPKHIANFAHRYFLDHREHILRTYESHAWALGSVHFSLQLRGAISDLLPQLRAALPTDFQTE